jgi:hypothetical protein
VPFFQRPAKKPAKNADYFSYIYYISI